MSPIKVFLIIFIMIITFTISNTPYAKRGCCSWHGGVASCDTNLGRQICRDGTYSPSCTCEREERAIRNEPEKNIKNKLFETTHD